MSSKINFGLFLDLMEMFLVCEKMCKTYQSLWPQGSFEEEDGNVQRICCSYDTTREELQRHSSVSSAIKDPGVITEQVRKSREGERFLSHMVNYGLRS